MKNVTHNATYANGQAGTLHNRANNNVYIIGNQVKNGQDQYEDGCRTLDDHTYEDVPSLRGSKFINAPSSTVQTPKRRKRRQRNINIAVVTMATLVMIGSACACAVMYWKMQQCTGGLHGELKQVDVTSALSGRRPTTVSPSGRTTVSPSESTPVPDYIDPPATAPDYSTPVTDDEDYSQYYDYLDGSGETMSPPDTTAR